MQIKITLSHHFITINWQISRSLTLPIANSRASNVGEPQYREAKGQKTQVPEKHVQDGLFSTKLKNKH